MTKFIHDVIKNVITLKGIRLTRINIFYYYNYFRMQNIKYEYNKMESIKCLDSVYGLRLRMTVS